MSRPLLSIVIPSFNSERYIGACLESLKNQRSDQIELILVDGGSADRTMEIVDLYRDIFTNVLSEPDNGQSDAFNKGFAMASGEYFTWLNSDDVFCPGSLSDVLKFISRRQYSWYTGNVVYFNERSEITRCCRSGAFEQFALSYGILNVFGPSTIFHRDIFERLGGFREDFHFCMDTEYWWRIAKSGIQYQRIPIYLWALRLHDDAKTASSITSGGSHRPKGMHLENELYKEMYFPSVTSRRRSLGKWLVRCFRLLNLSYVRSFISTFQYKGRHIEELETIK